jgi:hypothetical protein
MLNLLMLADMTARTRTTTTTPTTAPPSTPPPPAETLRGAKTTTAAQLTTRPPAKTLRVACINIGDPGLASGLSRHSNYLHSLATDNGVDLYFLTETQHADHYEIEQMGRTVWPEWKLLGCNRPRTLTEDGTYTPIYGGVALAATGDHIILQRVYRLPEGLLAAKVSSALNEWSPYLAVCMYCPPAGPFEHFNKKLAGALDKLLEENASAFGNNIILGGDLNLQLGKSNPSGTPRNSNTQRGVTKDKTHILNVLRKYGLAPLAGRNEEAPRTSRPLSTPATEMTENKGAESDYIMMPERVPRGTFTALPPPSWVDTAIATSKAFSHRPIMADIRTTPREEPTPGPLQQPAPPKKKARKIGQAFYGNADAYNRVAVETTARLAEVGPTLRDPNTTANATATTLFGALEAATQTAIPAPPQRGDKGPTAQTRPTGRGALPGPLVEALKKAKRARRKATVTQDPTAIEAAQRATKRAQRALRNFYGKGRAKLANELRLLRAASSKHFFRKVGDYSPDDPLSFGSAGRQIPPGKNGEPAGVAFGRAYSSLFTSRPPPPATKEEAWLKHVRNQPAERADAMARPFTAEEVAPLIYPVHNETMTGHKCNATGAHEPLRCPLCAHMVSLAKLYEGEGDPINAPPKHFPRGQAQSVTDVTDTELQLFHLAWARPKDEPYHDYRLRVAGGICTYLNKILAERKMPPELIRYVVVPIPKGTASGIQEDPSAPSNYRWIVLSNLATKILSLALDARLKHWAARDPNIMSTSSQGAFMPLLSTEWNALALTECIKAQWRAKKTAYVLFVDLKDAYPSVHPVALAAVLRRQGLPPALVSIIETWLTARTAVMRVNGASSDPTPTAMGLGQGDAHSPILFNIFINSLSNFLHARGHSLGVNNEGNRVIHLAFADDIAGPDESTDKLQQHLRLIEEWATAWGFELKVGEKKTAVMCLPPPGRRQKGATQPPPLPPITLTSGAVAPWVQSYKYLGLVLTPTLNLETALDAVIGRLRNATTRYFGFNTVTWRLDNVSRVQLLKCAFSPYLLALVPPTEGNITRLQRELNKMSRMMLLLPSAFSDADTVITEAGIPPALYAFIRARLGTLLSLRLTPHQDAPAAASIRAHTAATGRSNTTSWVATTMKFLQKFEDLGAGPYQDIRAILGIARAPHLGDVTQAAQVYARRACLAQALATRPAPPNGGPYITRLSQRVPAGEGSIHHNLALALSLEHYDGLLGTLPYTPMSCRIPLGAGSPLPLCTSYLRPEQRGALAQIRLGAIALAMELGPTAWRILGPDAKPAPQGTDLWQQAKRGRPCPFCPGSTADPFHVVHECAHPAVAEAREETRDKALEFIPVLLEHIQRATQTRNGCAPPAGGWRLPPHVLQTHSWASTTSGNLLLRILIAAPWPAAAVDDANARVALHLGRCFDKARLSNTSLHQIYNSWCGFGSRATLKLFAVYREAVDGAHGGGRA